MNKLLALLLSAASPFFSLAAACAAEPRDTPPGEVPPLDPEHTLLARVLERVATPSGVDYAALRADHADLDAYRTQLARAPVPASGAARMAHFINAYNAWTLALVVDHLPADRAAWSGWSIRSLGAGVLSVWRRFTFELGGKRLSLDQVEHEILRKLGDPRIHFALNCASRSCPALAATPYLARTLERDLERATERFLRDPTQLRVVGDAVQVNPILDWFAADFESAGGVRAFLEARLPEGPTRDRLREGRLAFFDYDWRLNLRQGAR